MLVRCFTTNNQPTFRSFNYTQPVESTRDDWGYSPRIAIGSCALGRNGKTTVHVDYRKLFNAPITATVLTVVRYCPSKHCGALRISTLLIGNTGMISRKVATVLHYYGSPSSPHAISILEFIVEDLMNDRIGDSRNSVDSNIVECWVVWSNRFAGRSSTHVDIGVLVELDPAGSLGKRVTGIVVRWNGFGNNIVVFSPL
jgi:hypothetical protein